MIEFVKRKFCLCLIFILILNINMNIKALENKDNKAIKQDLLCLMLSYSEYIKGIEVKDNGLIYINMKSGKLILYDDKRVKSFEEKLVNADIQDTMEQLYPLSFPTALMTKNFDPGRFRSYELLKEVYGENKSSIEGRLKTVNTGYSNLQFNSNNGAANELKAAMNEIKQISKTNVNVNRALFPTSGTFNYRYISGTNRLSPHAFGIAIDLASNKNDYWKWAPLKEGEKRLLSYPKDLVEVFEKHNFVWGGKWNHFDILHYEYRPEIILKARYFNGNHDKESTWFNGVPLDNINVKEKIEYIDRMKF